MDIYHVLEGPAPKGENPDKQGSGNIYHVLEGPTISAGSSDRNPDKQENVYDILEEGAIPKDESHSMNKDDQKRGDIYHVLESPIPTEDEI